MKWVKGIALLFHFAVQGLSVYYKPITFSSFTLNSIKFYLITFAISDIFSNFASTFPTDEMNIKIRL